MDLTLQSKENGFHGRRAVSVVPARLWGDVQFINNSNQDLGWISGAHLWRGSATDMRPPLPAVRANTVRKSVKVICLVILVSFFVLSRQKYKVNVGDIVSNKNPLDGCEFVYLDMGTNTGVQIRKLYEPDKFPGAAVLPIFERYFGPAAGRNLSAVCAMGWEPNPVDTARLARLQAAYRRCGWRVKIHAETGVAARQEVAQLARLGEQGLWAASQVLSENTHPNTADYSTSCCSVGW